MAAFAVITPLISIHIFGYYGKGWLELSHIGAFIGFVIVLILFIVEKAHKE